MASIKFHYRPATCYGAKEGKLFIRIIHKRKSRSVTTHYSLRPEEWESETETVILTNDPDRYHYLSGIAGKVSEDRKRLKSLISELSARGEYDVEDVVSGFKGNIVGASDTLAVYCEKVCKALETSGQKRTARAYRSAVRSFEKFAAERCRGARTGFVGQGGYALKGVEKSKSGQSCIKGGGALISPVAADTDFYKSSPGCLLSLSDLNASMMKDYEGYLLEKGLYLNTVSFYMRQLRAIYYRAVKEKAVRRREDNPFGEVFTGVHKTRPRALTESELNALASLEITLDKRMRTLTRETAASGSDYDDNMDKRNSYLKLKSSLLIFLFCFHARGMSYVDMAYLKKSDIGENTIIYKRRKTGRFLEVGITKPMREIMEWFAADAVTNDTNGSNRGRSAKNSPYVFPIIDPACGNERTQYESGLRRQNEMLGLLSKMAGMNKKVTTHVSRHTWATVAKWRKVPVAVISEALGHRDTKTTEHYLASFDQSVLDMLSAEMSGVIKKGNKAA